MRDSVVIYDRDTRNSRGFGFVTFKDASVAQTVLGGEGKTSNMISIHDKECEVKMSVPKPHGSVNNDTNCRTERNRIVLGENKCDRNILTRKCEFSQKVNGSNITKQAGGTNVSFVENFEDAMEHHDDTQFGHYPICDTVTGFNSSSPFYMYPAEFQPILPPSIGPSSAPIPPHYSTHHGQFVSEPRSMLHPMSSQFQYPGGSYYNFSQIYTQPDNFEAQQLCFPYVAQTYAMVPYPPMIMPFPQVPPLQQNGSSANTLSDEKCDLIDDKKPSLRNVDKSCVLSGDKTVNERNEEGKHEE